MYRAQNQLLWSYEPVLTLQVKFLLPCTFSVLTFDYDVMGEEVEINFESLKCCISRNFNYGAGNSKRYLLGSTLIRVKKCKSFSLSFYQSCSDAHWML